MRTRRLDLAIFGLLPLGAAIALGACSEPAAGAPAGAAGDALDLGTPSDASAPEPLSDLRAGGLPGADLPAAPDLSQPDLTPVPAVLVRVAGGTFQMGTPEGSGLDSERPVHGQTVGTFFLDRTEVTVGAYGLCVQARGCTPPATGPDCNFGQPGRELHPVNCVSWEQATAYCAQQGKRLPSEIEWEYAARGPLASTYPWGEEAPASQLCWSGAGLRLGTCPVDSFPRTLLGRPDPSGLADLGGNVWEWVQDWKCGYPLAGVSGGVLCSTVEKTLRGGSFGQDNPVYVRAMVRDNHRPTNQNHKLGFRCATSP